VAESVNSHPGTVGPICRPSARTTSLMSALVPCVSPIFEQPVCGNYIH
jgi:hypothetical protein